MIKSNVANLLSDACSRAACAIFGKEVAVIWPAQPTVHPQPTPNPVFQLTELEDAQTADDGNNGM